VIGLANSNRSHGLSSQIFLFCQERKLFGFHCRF
jgi:hypothetical protein